MTPISIDRKKLIDKVTKLLNQAEGTNHEAEAETAKRLAAELMAKHNITVSDLIQKGEETFGKKDQLLKARGTHRFDTDLHATIASFNGVVLMIGEGRNDKGQIKAKYTFVGRPADIEATEYMIDIIIHQRKEAYTKRKQWYIDMHGYDAWDRDESDWRQWHNGFTRGVAAKLHELKTMADKKVQEWGLVPVNPKDLALQWLQKDLGQKTKPMGGRMGSGSRSGYDAGKSVNVNKGVGHTSNDRKMLN